MADSIDVSEVSPKVSVEEGNVDISSSNDQIILAQVPKFVESTSTDKDGNVILDLWEYQWGSGGHGAIR